AACCRAESGSGEGSHKAEKRTALIRWEARPSVEIAMKSLADFIGDQEIAALEPPLGEATGLPGRAFSAEFFQLEQRSFFPRIWCPAGFASDIPDPGDALPVELAGWPILLVPG